MVCESGFYALFVCVHASAYVNRNISRALVGFSYYGHFQEYEYKWVFMYSGYHFCLFS